MKKIICSPSKYVQGPGLIDELASFTESLGNDNAYIIAGGTVWKKYKDGILEGFDNAGYKYDFVRFGGEVCKSEIDKHIEGAKGYDTIIGIGGGKILDLAKMVANHHEIPETIVPTIASTNAPCSRVSVIYHEDGVYSHYENFPTNPDLVVVDTEVILNAPKRYLISGIGDALATFYGANACRKSGAITLTGGVPTHTAMALPKICLDNLLEYGVDAIDAICRGVRDEAFEIVVESNIYLSGLGFESCGMAAAHSIHNGLTALKETSEFLHGEKVAIGTLGQMVLEDRSYIEIEKVKKFYYDVGLPTRLSDIGITNLDRDYLRVVSEIATAENEYMHNMPFEVTAEMVVDALLSLT